MSKKAKRRIKAAKISLISLVPAGANRITSLFKDKDAVEMQALAKIDAEGYLTALVYLPDSVDSHGDMAKADNIKQWAHDYIPNMEGNGIDVLHDGEPVGNDRAHICETFLVQKGDPRFVGMTDDEGQTVDPTGAWGVVLKIDDPDLRSRYATGEWVGVSMFGSAIVEPLTKSTPPTKEFKMDETQMAALLKAFGTNLSSDIVAGLSKALKPDPVKPTEPVKVEKTVIAFEGDITKSADVAAHAEKVLFASLDMSNPADITKWQAVLAKKAADATPNPNQERIDTLEKELAKLSGAPANGAEPVVKTGELSLGEKLAKSTERAARLKKAGIIR